jgi:hypothetical protein
MSFPLGRAQRPSEYELKAVFLYNFAKFVEWPAEAFPGPSSPIVIGIAGHDPFGAAIDEAVSGKTANGRAIVVRRMKSSEDLRSCHILFIAIAEASRAARILRSTEGASVLTVGEMPHFSRRGGIVNFLIERNHVHFEINKELADRANLKISSRLLKLAKEPGP